jgi:hypothetical protein
VKISVILWQLIVAAFGKIDKTASNILVQFKDFNLYRKAWYLEFKNAFYEGFP